MSSCQDTPTLRCLLVGEQPSLTVTWKPASPFSMWAMGGQARSPGSHEGILSHEEEETEPPDKGRSGFSTQEACSTTSYTDLGYLTS